ncbi:hypothetical protein WJX72_001916 [[Myrmecia] bisecta]|uniref:Uncharacterized protein n=1 Tax=[Myrmecia] bisecta TaxID=41462 RepID=A0AAW1PPC7_9CHLO
MQELASANYRAEEGLLGTVTLQRDAELAKLMEAGDQLYPMFSTLSSCQVLKAPFTAVLDSGTQMELDPFDMLCSGLVPLMEKRPSQLLMRKEVALANAGSLQDCMAGMSSALQAEWGPQRGHDAARPLGPAGGPCCLRLAERLATGPQPAVQPRRGHRC